MNGCPRVSEIRQALVQVALTALEPEGWQVSPFAPGLTISAPDPLEPRESAHRSFRVAATSTTPWQGDRQRPRARAVLATTTCVVTWSWALRADEQAASYDEALDGEERLIAGVLGIDDAALPFPARLVTSRRRVAGGWVLGEFELEVQHPLNLGLREVST